MDYWKLCLLALVSAGILTACPSPTPTPTLTVSPTTATLTAGTGLASFSATLTNSTAAISWTISPNTGTLSTATGTTTTYTPPATIATATAITLTANAAGLSATAQITVNPGAAVISVTGVTPSTGSTAGGSSITITGTGFVSGATVSMGGTAATGVTFGSSTSLTATTPAHAAGAVAVVVTNPNTQTGSLGNAYIYVAPPAVTSVTPNSGTISGGTSVTITGTGFVSGATVSIGGTAATGVTFGSSTSLTATTPAHAAGAVAFVVTNPDTQTGSLANAYTYIAPTQLSKVNYKIDLTYLGGSFSVTADLNQNGDIITGSVQDTIDTQQTKTVTTTGKILGSSITVKFVMDNAGSPRGEFTCTGTISVNGSTITGTFTASSGEGLGGSTGSPLSGNCNMQ